MQKCNESRSDENRQKNIGCECIESFSHNKFGNFLRLWRHYKATTDLLTTPLVFLGEIGFDCSQKCSQKAGGHLAKRRDLGGIYIYHINYSNTHSPSEQYCNWNSPNEQYCNRFEQFCIPPASAPRSSPRARHDAPTQAAPRPAMSAGGCC